MDNRIDSLQNSIRTKDELIMLLAAIEDLLSNYHYISSNSANSLSSIQEKLLNEISLSGIQKDDMLGATDFLRNLKMSLDKIPVCKITMAFEPEAYFIDKLSSWVKSNIGLHYIIEIIVDSSVIGGAIVEVNGLYISMTLDDKFTNSLEVLKEKLAINL